MKQYVTNILLVGIGLLLLLVFLKMDNDSSIILKVVSLNPPAEVMVGAYFNVTDVRTYAQDGTESRSIEFHLCSGQQWIVPKDDVETVGEWLQKKLAPHKGCGYTP